MNAAEFEKAFAETAGCNIIVRSRSGKLYVVHEDQLEGVRFGGMIYGSPVKKHIRAKNDVVWFKIENLALAEADDQVNI